MRAEGDVRQHTLVGMGRTHSFPSTPQRPCRPNGNDQLILTKGDNNDADDLGLYNGPRWMRRKNIVGKVRGCAFKGDGEVGRERVLSSRLTPSLPSPCLPSPSRYMPYVGYVTIALNDYPKLKYLLLGGLGLSLLMQKE